METTKRNLLQRALATVLLIFAGSCMWQTPPPPPPLGSGELQDLVNHYYEHPEPERLSQILRNFLAQGTLSDKSKAGSMQGFFGGVLNRNPDFVNEYVKTIYDARLDQDANISLSMALWFCGNDKCRETLASNPLNIPDSFFQETQKFLPKPFNEMPIHGPTEVDILWGWFTATGDAAPVARILTFVLSNEARAAKQKKKSGDLDFITAAAAERSLISQTRKHEKVAQIVKSCANRYPACKAILVEASRRG